MNDDVAAELHELHARVCRAQSNVSQHLAVLRERGVVSSRRVNTSVLYSLRGTKVLQAVVLLRKFSPRTWPSRVVAATRSSAGVVHADSLHRVMAQAGA